MCREQEQIRRAKEGDPAAFEALVTAYEAKMYHLALRYLGSREDAQDAVQEIFLRVYRFLDSFQQQSSFSTWIYRIGVNVCRDLYLQKHRRGEQSLESSNDEEQSPAEEIADLRYAPEDHAEKQELRELVQKALLSLPAPQKEILLLRDIQGLSYEEIAAALSMELGTVKSRIARARKNLQKKLLQNGNILAYFPSKNMEGGERE